MTPVKTFRILVEARGEGCKRDCQNYQDCQTSPELKGREACAIWDGLRMTPVKTFGILVEARGEGWHRRDADIAVIAEIGKEKLTAD